MTLFRKSDNGKQISDRQKYVWFQQTDKHLMLFLRLLVVILSPICAVSGVLDKQCVDNCSCCIDGKCGPGANGWTNVCTIGCIDGHRGERCYEWCQYPNCKSCVGNTDSNVCTECYDGYYLGPNKDCTSQCPSNCKSCTSSTVCTECNDGFYDKDGSTTCPYAHCPGNCECNDQGACISCKKGFYDTLINCTKQCPVNCLTCESMESCNECKGGFYNGYKYDNNINLLLNNCTYPCRDTCTQCQSYNSCLQCIEGKYGSTCQEDCSVGCKDKTCRFDNGQCECTEHYTGDKCLKCVDGKYGLSCEETCSKYCKDRICERTSGHCSAGCIDNFDGTKCDACINGKYGTSCELKCPVNCADNVCERKAGTCFDCVENFQGSMCDECKLGYYGQNCDVPCSLRCANNSCIRDTGYCAYGCMCGYSGDKCCVMSNNCAECDTETECKTCVPGFFKSSCNETCPKGCSNSCHILTGECTLSEVAQQQNGVSYSGLIATAAVFGTMFTLLFAVVMVLLVLVMLNKIKVSWRKHSQEDREPTYENQLKSVGEQFPRTTRNATDTLYSAAVERNVYEGISSVNEKEHEYQKVSFDHENML